MKKQASQTGARVFLILLALVLACGSVAVFLLDTRTDETVFDYVSKHRTGVGQLTEQPVTQAFTFTQDPDPDGQHRQGGRQPDLGGQRAAQ